jgi:hypothetical protein
VESQFLLVKGTLQAVDELATKDAPEHLYRQEKGVARVNPAGVIWRQTSGRDHTMYVRVSEKVLPPGMQHAEEADFGPEVLRIRGDLDEGLGTGTKQQAVEDAFVLQR